MAAPWWPPNARVANAGMLGCGPEAVAPDFDAAVSHGVQPRIPARAATLQRCCDCVKRAAALGRDVATRAQEGRRRPERTLRPSSAEPPGRGSDRRIS